MVRRSGALRGRWRTAGLAALCALVLMLLSAPEAGAQIVRIGFVDSQRIFEGYRGAQDAQERFTREITAWRTEADERRRALDVLRDELKDQEVLLSEAKKLEKETAVQRAVADYDRFVQEFWGPGGRVGRLNEEMTREVYEALVRRTLEAPEQGPVLPPGPPLEGDA